MLCYIVAAPVYNLNTHTVFPFLHVLNNALFFILLMIAIWTGVRWYITVIFDVEFPDSCSDVEHLFMSLNIHVSPFR